jgi:hypothetical protein
MLQKSKDYIEKTQDHFKEFVVGINDKGQEITENKWIVDFPTAEGLANSLKVSRKILYDWANRHPEFRDILDQINQNQVERLLNNGLSGNYNATIAKLVLAKHGYKESTETEITQNNPTEINIKIQKAIDKAYGQPSNSDSS